MCSSHKYPTSIVFFVDFPEEDFPIVFRLFLRFYLHGNENIVVLYWPCSGMDRQKLLYPGQGQHKTLSMRCQECKTSVACVA